MTNHVMSSNGSFSGIGHVMLYSLKMNILYTIYSVRRLSGAPNNGFLLNALKSLFRPSTVLFDLQKYNLTSAIKFISVQSFYSNLSLFQITKASELFSRNFRCNSTFYESEFFSDSSFCFFFEKQLNLGSETWKIKLQRIVGNLLHKLWKLYMNGTVIKKFLAFLKI